MRRLLVANRGEIAVRILRAAQECGIETVAVYSEADRDAAFVAHADFSRPLTGVASRDTYLSVPQLLAAAHAAGADAVHPGYGFLSEDADFARAVEEAGLLWVGPPPAAMAAMGEKIRAREIMAGAGVPIPPGRCLTPGEDPRSAAGAVGYPLLVKASAGGGGRGMRRVAAPEELRPALESAISEAEKAFGDGTVFLERDLNPARHIEIQVMGDRFGTLVHLGERECSVQRRHQKVVEETPSPIVDAELRARMGETAVRAARAVGYRNAGTVEFLLDERGEYYFLEMNTRLQVEHPVTEWVAGVDLVQAQLRVARGEPVPWTQTELTPRGHAVECRICAEDPARNFLPGSGTIQVYREPGGPGIRVDSGVAAGSRIGIHYDPLLAKLIAWGETRAAALERLDRALGEYVILGVPTNLVFLRRLLRHPEFRAGRLHTRFLEQHPISCAPPPPPPEALAVAGVLQSRRNAGTLVQPGRRIPNPWLEGSAWRVGQGLR